MDTTATIHTLARRTAITVPNGSGAACLSARGLGITGLTGIVDFTAGPATIAGAGMNAAGAATGIMTDGAIAIDGVTTIMTVGVTGGGTVTADSTVITDTGTDAIHNGSLGTTGEQDCQSFFLSGHVFLKKARPD